MLKHRGFPGRLPGSDFQFVIRRANPRGVTPLIRRERYADRKPADRRADAAFMEALWLHFGTEPFERGNLDSGRLSWLFGREVVPAEEPFDPKSYEALLRIEPVLAARSFPGLVEEIGHGDDPDADDWDDDRDDGDDEDDETPTGGRKGGRSA